MMQRSACITLRVPRYAGSVSPHPRVQLGCVRGPQRAEERCALFVWREASSFAPKPVAFGGHQDRRDADNKKADSRGCEIGPASCKLSTED